MSPHWISTDKFRQPRPEVKRKVWQPVFWTVFATFLSIAVMLFSANLGNHIHANGKTYLPQRLRRHLSPKLYRQRDYADITMGAEIVLAFTSRAYTTEKDSVISSFYDTGPQRRAAELVFRSRHENDGRCWEIDGGAGTISVRLSERLTPTAIAVHQSFQHQLSPRAIMAPRRLTVWAIDGGTPQGYVAESRERRPISDFLVSGRTVPKDIKGRSVVKVMDFEFAQHSGVPVQVFPIPTSPSTDLLIVEVEKNWGGERTCIQRIAVY